jgi:hypothetical protein
VVRRIILVEVYHELSKYLGKSLRHLNHRLAKQHSRYQKKKRSKLEGCHLVTPVADEIINEPRPIKRLVQVLLLPSILALKSKSIAYIDKNKKKTKKQSGITLCLQ